MKPVPQLIKNNMHPPLSVCRDVYYHLATPFPNGLTRTGVVAFDLYSGSSLGRPLNLVIARKLLRKIEEGEMLCAR